MASPAADLPGMWSLEVYNEDTLYTKIAFEIVSDGSSSKAIPRALGRVPNPRRL
jgi:hypothetical protein